MMQGTEEWRLARVGKVGASRVADIIAKTKSGPSASRKNYAAELVVERLTGVPTEGYTNGAMQWGAEKEPEARAAYEFFRDVTVEEVGFIAHPSIAMAGASPDGLVGADGVLEIKAPNSAQHIDTLLTKAIPDKYLVQMLWQMACTGRKWADFCSYDPRMPGDLQLFVQRVPRDDKRIAALEREVVLFLTEVEATIAALTGRSQEHLTAKLRASLDAGGNPLPAVMP